MFIIRKSILFFAIFFLTKEVWSGTLYQWKDDEGVSQFSSIPPPISCLTDSCKNIHKKLKVKIENKIKIESALTARKEQLAKEKELKGTTLVKGTGICRDVPSLDEYANVEDARKFLIEEQKCQLVEENTKYSFISRRKNFAKIRLYLSDGKSDIKWIESKYIIIPKNK
ncbi:MAG: hypothetical protein HQL46_10555 [Gammaproteobacteria bacterium]|nr:hypothetical protein [Gammaproteobacteria bacterium]